MSAHNLGSYLSMGVGGPYGALIETGSRAETVEAIQALDAVGTPVLVLGGGSNLVVDDAGWFGGLTTVAGNWRTLGVNLSGALHCTLLFTVHCHRFTLRRNKGVGCCLLKSEPCWAARSRDSCHRFWRRLTIVLRWRPSTPTRRIA